MGCGEWRDGGKGERHDFIRPKKKMSDRERERERRPRLRNGEDEAKGEKKKSTKDSPIL